MAHIQMTDRNPSDLGLMEELTDEELLVINGGGIWDGIKETASDVASTVSDVVSTVSDVVSTVAQLQEWPSGKKGRRRR